VIPAGERPGNPATRWTAFPKRIEQRSPDRQASIQRRRRLAASGPMPPAMAARFTVGELAVLRIVGDEVTANGTCDRSLAEIAARAGVCRKLAQLTLRMAAREGLIAIDTGAAWAEKPKQPRPDHLSRVDGLVAARPSISSGTGGKNCPPTDKRFRKRIAEEGS
jgi:hypothetical protein